jgi:Fe-S cluster assembly protein SufD
VAITSETLDQLQGEPGWLRERREAAIATFEKLPAPSKTDEEWRRTDVSRLDPNQFSKLEHLDGQKLILAEALPQGVILEPLRIAADKHRDLIEPRLFSLVHADRDRFTALHAALFTGGTFL